MSQRSSSLLLAALLSTLTALVPLALADPGANSPFAGMSQREMWCQVLNQGIGSPARKAHAREECFGKLARFDKVESWQGRITLTRHYTCAERSGTKTVRANFSLKRTPYVSNAEVASAIRGQAPAAVTVFQHAMARMPGAKVVIRRNPTTGYTESPNELSWFLTGGKLDASIGTHGSDGDTSHSENGSGSAAIAKQARLIFDLEQGTWSLELPPVNEKGFPVTLVTTNSEGTTTEHDRESLDDLNSLDGFTDDRGLNKLPADGLQLVGHVTLRQDDCERDALTWRLTPAADCGPYKDLEMDIEAPVGNAHWVFDTKDAPARFGPYRVIGDAYYTKGPKGTVLADIREMLQWKLPDVPGVTRHAKPTDLNGSPIRVTYAGMPTQNSAFGKAQLSASLPKLGGCATPEQKQVELFFARDGRGNRKGTQEPNWFYYWLQTKAGGGHSSADVVYEADRSTCRSDPKKGYYVAGYFGWNPNDDKVIHLCHGIVETYWRNPITGRVATGIDAYATTVLHEFGHKKHYDAWWLKIDRQIAADNKRGDKHDATTLEIKRALLDRDGDDIPDALECHRSKKTGKQICPHWPGIIAGIFDSCRRSGGRDADHSDEHCLIYRYEQTKWRLGTANKQDWACPGKQSGDTCGGDSAAKDAAGLSGDDSGSGGSTPSSGGRARATGGDSAAETVKSVVTGPKPHTPQGPSASPALSPDSAAGLLTSPDPIVQQRGLAAVDSLSALSPPQRAAILLPAFKRILTGASPAPVPFNTGFVPREDWIRLRYLSSVAALGPKALPALRAARDKASGVYREYLTLSLAAAGEPHPLRLLKPLVRHGSTWVIRRQAVFLLGDRVGERADVQQLLKATLRDPGQVKWRSDVGGLHGYQRQLYPVRDAAALMLYNAGYAIDRTKNGGYVAVSTPAVKHAGSGANAAPVLR